MILPCLDDAQNTGTAKRLHTRPNIGGKWRIRFIEQGAAGLPELPRPGKTLKTGRMEKRHMWRNCYWAGIFWGAGAVLTGILYWLAFLDLADHFPPALFVVWLAISAGCVLVSGVLGFLAPAAYEPRCYPPLKACALAGLFLVAWGIHGTSAEQIILLPMVFLTLIFLLSMHAQIRSLPPENPWQIRKALLILYSLLAIPCPLLFAGTLLFGWPTRLFASSAAALGARFVYLNQWPEILLGFFLLVFGLLFPLAGILEIVRAIRYGRGRNAGGGRL